MLECPRSRCPNVKPSLSAVTLAVQDLGRSREFYEAMGWTCGFSNDEVAFYRANGLVLSLWQAAAFAKETGLGTASQGICLAHNVPTRTQVDAILAEAGRRGATVSPAAERAWGGYSGHFRDPDGHTWEVAWNPHWPLAPDGSVRLA